MFGFGYPANEGYPQLAFGIRPDVIVVNNQQGPIVAHQVVVVNPQPQAVFVGGYPQVGVPVVVPAYAQVGAPAPVPVAVAVPVGRAHVGFGKTSQVPIKFGKTSQVPLKWKRR